MNIKLGKTKREKTLISIFIALAVASVYFQILVRPAIGVLSGLLPKVSLLDKDLKAAISLIENRDIIEEERERLKQRMDEYGQAFLTEKEIPTFHEKISDIANKSDVRIISIKPLAGKKGDIYNEKPFEIIAKSGFHELGDFLQKLETGDRFVTVEDIEISSDPKYIVKHDVKLIVNTYILTGE